MSSEPLFIFSLMTSEGNLDMSEHLKTTSIIWKVAWVVLFCFVASTTRTLFPQRKPQANSRSGKWIPASEVTFVYPVLSAQNIWPLRIQATYYRNVILFLLVNPSFLRLYISLLVTVISGGRISALQKFSWVLTFLGHSTTKGFLVYVHY